MSSYMGYEVLTPVLAPMPTGATNITQYESERAALEQLKTVAQSKPMSGQVQKVRFLLSTYRAQIARAAQSGDARKVLAVYDDLVRRL